MAELIWKDKNNTHKEKLTPSSPTPKGFHILQSFNGHLSSEQPATLHPSTPAWHNRLIWGDKKDVLPALLSEFAGHINLIYIDPPFMTGRNFKSGSQLAYSDTWKNNLDTYLRWLNETFILLRLLLTENGSLYVHLDWRVVHYAKVILDEVFGFTPNAKGPGFKSEIIWHYESGGRSQKSYARKHDTILLYTKSPQYCFHRERIGERRGPHKRNHMRKQIGADGHVQWTIRSAGQLYTYDQDAIMTPSDVWSDISHLHQKDPERNGYASQKPTALLERIILASSEENDLVLDCFCGSGVTPAVAEQLGRRWVASDASHLAIEITQKRLLARAQVQPFVLQQVVDTVSNQAAENGTTNLYDIIKPTS